MLELRKAGIFSNEYVVEENGSEIGRLRRSTWQARGEIVVRGQTLRLKKYGALKETFVLTDGDTTIAEVVQPSAVRSRLVFRFDDKDYEVRGKSWLSSTQVVVSEGLEVGRIRPRRLFGGGAIVELPHTLPLTLRVFVGWIAMVRWDAADAAAVASGAAG